MSSETWLDWGWVQAHRTEVRVRESVNALVARACLDPTGPLVSIGDRVISAGDFACLASSIASRLVDDGDNSPVVVLVDRSATSVGAILGVQWAGRCLVPVGIDEPRARIESVIARVGACSVANATSTDVADIAGRCVISLADVPDRWIDPVPFASDRPARIIFTSGSTGRPKGVIWAGWQVDTSANHYRDHPKLRFATFAPLQWLAGLGAVHQSMFGGCVRFLDASTISTQDILEDLRKFDVQKLSLTSSFLHSLSADVTRFEPLPSLEKVTLAGEAATWQAVGVARSLSAKDVLVQSVYGASEAMRMLTRIEVQPDDELQCGPLPMGELTSPDVRLEPMSDGDDVVYELIAKRWVVDGYLGDPDLERERFGVDANGDRFWRSGDVVSIDDDGVLHYRGRSDDMVKMAGKLVEPSEAQRVLRACPGVLDAVVLPRRLHSGRTQLIAHVAATPGTSAAVVRSTLVGELPGHLIPAAIVRHDLLPITERGKVDRQALIAHPVVPWRADTPRHPKTKLETFVVREASLLLGIEGLGTQDNLWSFGLDSLGAIELSEVLAKHFSTSLAPNDFIGASTPAAIAQLLNRHRVPRASHVVEFEPQVDDRSVFIMTGGGDPVLAVRHLAAGLMSHWHVHGVEQYGLQQRGRPDRTVRSAARRNLAEITKIQPSGPYALVGHSWGGLVAHEMAVRLRDQGHDVALALLDTPNPAGGLSKEHVQALLEAEGMSSRERRSLETWTERRRWLLHRIGNIVRQYTTSANRYWTFFRVAVRSTKLHRPSVFGGPMLVIDAGESTASTTWGDEPQLRAVSVPGKHRTILDPPHVDSLVVALRAFLSECSEAWTRDPEE